ncbi:hypothetical protein TL16_g06787 [Triparma laevis f. inornata]|uniref:C2H2-type domain-containing protein n=1 Tax=Triparma laevis f. inornata TaxID=1714386 RepID=A0A9W7AQC2_9STRA|nr:hypothetical protein TL16_g06787 [Triparma laevis f. inornata]
MKRHKQGIHNIDVVWHQCEECIYKSKQAGNLKLHKKTKTLKPTANPGKMCLIPSPSKSSANYQTLNHDSERGGSRINEEKNLERTKLKRHQFDDELRVLVDAHLSG